MQRLRRPRHKWEYYNEYAGNAGQNAAQPYIIPKAKELAARLRGGFKVATNAIKQHFFPVTGAVFGGLIGALPGLTSNNLQNSVIGAIEEGKKGYKAGQQLKEGGKANYKDVLGQAERGLQPLFGHDPHTKQFFQYGQELIDFV